MESDKLKKPLRLKKVMTEIDQENFDLDEAIKAHDELMNSSEWVEIPSDTFTIKDEEGLKQLEIEDAKEQHRKRLAFEPIIFGSCVNH